MSNYNDPIIAEFRANGGKVGNFGSSLVLMHTIGAKSGEERVIPVMAIRDGEDWVAVASAGGSPKSPAWYFNLIAHPDIDLETGQETVAVHTAELTGEEYDRVWTTFVSRAPAFGKYAETTQGRVMPILRFSRR